MIHSEHSSSSSTLVLILVLAFLVVAALAMGPLINMWHVGAREMVILVLVILLGLLVLMPSEPILKLGFLVWIVTFGFGWRTIHISDSLNIHPAEVLAWILFFAVFTRSVIRRVPLDFSISPFILLFLLFVIFGIFTALSFGLVITDAVIQESKIFFVLIPSYYIVKWFIRTREDWERAALLGTLVATYVGLLGVMDYFLPELSHRLAGNAEIQTLYLVERQGFERVGFVFYGNFSAGFLLFTFLGLAFHFILTSERPSWLGRSLSVVFVLVLLFGIYVSGYRGLWFAVGLFLLAFAFVKSRAWILVGATFGVIPFLPIEFLNRLTSLFDVTLSDSSQFKHFDRASFALDWVQQYPLTGVGFGGSGYVHSDLIQIAGNLGVPALLVFLAIVGALIFRLYGLARQAGWLGEYAASLFATLWGLLVLFAGEGLIVWIQLMVPVWFVFAMAYKLIELSSQEDGAPTVNLSPSMTGYQNR